MREDEGGRMRQRELFWGLISLQQVPGTGERSRELEDWPSSTLTRIQLHPGLKIRVKCKVGGPQAGAPAYMANVGVSLWA